MHCLTVVKPRVWRPQSCRDGPYEFVGERKQFLATAAAAESCRTEHWFGSPALTSVQCMAQLVGRHSCCLPANALPGTMAMASWVQRDTICKAKVQQSIFVEHK